MEVLAILAVLVLCSGGCDAVLEFRRPDPNVDTQGIPELLSSYLAADGNHGDILVVGSGRAVRALVEQLPPGTPRMAFSSTLVVTPDAREVYNNVDAAVAVVVMVGDAPEELMLRKYKFANPRYKRMLLWTRAAGPRDVLARLDAALPMWLCRHEVALAAPAANSTTVLFAVTSGACRAKRRVYNVTEVDRWSGGARRWQRQVLPFGRPCSRHPWGQGERARAPLKVIGVLPASNMSDRHPFRKFVTSVLGAVGRPVRVDWLSAVGDNLTRLRQDGKGACAFAPVFSFYSNPVDDVGREWVSSDYLMPVQVLMPTRMGRHPGLLQVMTSEFSVELWCATVLTLLAVAAAMAAAAVAILDRPPLAAVMLAPLQTLAPLLAQPPPGRIAHRPLSAVWLLMSVVLLAAYQGLLLRELTTPPGEINSLEQLEQSGLEVIVDDNLCMHAGYFLPEGLYRRVRFALPEDLPSAVRAVAEGRKSAVVLPRDVHAKALVMPYTNSKQLHAFEIKFQVLSSNIVIAKGWPLARQLSRVMHHTISTGVYQHTTKAMMGVYGRWHTVAAVSGPVTRPLTLQEMKPAFIALGFGNCLALFVFVLELAYQNLPTAARRFHPFRP
ncbi:Ionotropic receptor 212 [Frankliniella occidentalis]|nr:Ionotropic receptor 212 [Frankliniella occidentalis]